MTQTFIDSGVLIAAARGNTIRSLAALEILNDSDRVFASSVFIQLETLPKAIDLLQNLLLQEVGNRQKAIGNRKKIEAIPYSPFPIPDFCKKSNLQPTTQLPTNKIIAMRTSQHSARMLWL